MSLPEKKFNKLFLIIPIAIISIIMIMVLVTSINTDIKEHEAFREIEICDRDIFLDGFDTLLDLCLYNPNLEYSVKLDRIEASIFSRNNEIASVDVPKNVEIPSNSQKIITVDLTIKKTGLLTAGFDLVRNNDVNLRAAGTVHYDSIFGTHEIQFNKDVHLRSQNEDKIDRVQYCSNTVHTFIDIVEFAILNNLSERELGEQIKEIEYQLKESFKICEVTNGEGIVNTKYLDHNTKQRVLDFKEYMIDYQEYFRNIFGN